MNKTQAGRLLTLAHYLRTQVKPKEFDLDSYAHISWSRDAIYKEFDSELLSAVKIEERVRAKLGCGTTACAMGHATTIWPDMFALRFDNDFWNPGWELVMQKSGRKLQYYAHYVQEFFGIDYDEAYRLFSASHKRTPRQEAREIEKVVARYGWEYGE